MLTAQATPTGVSWRIAAGEAYGEDQVTLTCSGMTAEQPIPTQVLLEGADSLLQCQRGISRFPAHDKSTTEAWQWLHGQDGSVIHR